MDGVGAFCGAILIALWAKPRTFARFYIGGVFAYLLMLPVFALAPDALFAGTVLLITGLANAGFSIMQATLVFLAAPPEMRSRIFGVLSVCIGIGLIGFIQLGVLAGLIGAAWATATSARSRRTCASRIAWKSSLTRCARCILTPHCGRKRCHRPCSTCPAPRRAAPIT